MSVYASTHVKLSFAELKEILFWAGATILQEKPKIHDESTIIIGSEEDIEDLDSLIQLGYDIYTLEFLVLGILQQILVFSKNILVDHKNPGVFETLTKRIRRKRSM